VSDDRDSQNESSTRINWDLERTAAAINSVPNQADETIVFYEAIVKVYLAEGLPSARCFKLMPA
jgi:hypothetical protein